MEQRIDDLVVEFFDDLFQRVFLDNFNSQISQRRKLQEVTRQVQESADAASQSLTRFFLNQQLKEKQVTEILECFKGLDKFLKLEDIGNPNVTPEEVVENVLAKLPCPAYLQQSGHGAVYRIALHSIIQVLMLVGPVMVEWQKLNFSSTFELPRRITNRLNQISEQMNILGRSGQEAADERYELLHRDYLLQRFHRVEAGTVRMTTNLNVDLNELFVMPNVKMRPLPKKSKDEDDLPDKFSLMDLAAARKFFEDSRSDDDYSKEKSSKKEIVTALDQVKSCPRNVIIGPPGSGKSTFFEWLQLKIAAVEENLIINGRQAIPLLLRVRQLDPKNLPLRAALIEKATASKDRANLMPDAWIERRMKKGHILFMLDGLDETEPELRDKYILPWVHELCQAYPKCHFLVSSRPQGYPPGTLLKLKFTESDLLDFAEPQVAEYTRHWCTAVRLARNEPEEEARREGTKDGEKIVKGFKDHPYIRNLARNPLMLSAICLVNYFEGGQLPEDRAVLYKLCVEGLLHYWDQRRGIHSEFTFNDKLRVCREVAVTMQADDKAECELAKVQKIFDDVLMDSNRSKRLLEHIRYRTGLLMERRPNVFAFSHLTFQEYLAARAVHEGNRLGIDKQRLVKEHDDGRWHEVIALYCGLANTPATRDMLEGLITHPDTRFLSEVLAEAFFASRPEIVQDQALRRQVIKRIAKAPNTIHPKLNQFPPGEVAPIANRSIGSTKSFSTLSESFYWLHKGPEFLDVTILNQKLQSWKEMNPFQLTEVIHLLHQYGSDAFLKKMAAKYEIYLSPGPKFRHGDHFGSQAEIALNGIRSRLENLDRRLLPGEGFEIVMVTIFNSLLYCSQFYHEHLYHILDDILSEFMAIKWIPTKVITPLELAGLVRKLAEKVKKIQDKEVDKNYKADIINELIKWAEYFEGAADGAVPGNKKKKIKKQGRKER